jgi:translation initiation factor 2-alpha kinase 4
MRGHGEETHAVGCNIGWWQLFNSMAKYQRRLIKGQPRHGDEEANHSPWATRRCDVIVASFDSKTLRTEGLTIVQELWANGIRAELAADATSTESLVNTHKGDGVSWVVIIKQGLLGAAERNLKVKNVFRKDDYDLRQSDLVSFLKSELTERDRKALPMERHLLPARLPRHSSSNEVPRTSDEAGQDVRILISDRKGRKISRNTIIDAAQRTASDSANAFVRCPIAAVDLREDVLDNIKMTSFHDTEGWKRLIQGAPAPDRKYIQEVQELINEIANEGEKMCVIYNFRTGGCVFYYLA